MDKRVRRIGRTAKIAQKHLKQIKINKHKQALNIIIKFLEQVLKDVIRTCRNKKKEILQKKKNGYKQPSPAISGTWKTQKSQNNYYY